MEPGDLYPASVRPYRHGSEVLGGVHRTPRFFQPFQCLRVGMAVPVVPARRYDRTGGSDNIKKVLRPGRAGTVMGSLQNRTLFKVPAFHQTLFSIFLQISREQHGKIPI